VNSAGTVGSDDTLCPDLDGSQTNPPAFQGCEPDCTYGADPAILPGSSPGCEAEGTCWQYDVMRMEVCRPLRCRAENGSPAPREASPGEAGWRVARRHEKDSQPGTPAKVATFPVPEPGVLSTRDIELAGPPDPAPLVAATPGSTSSGQVPFRSRLEEMQLGLSAQHLTVAAALDGVGGGRPQSDAGPGWDWLDHSISAAADPAHAGGICLPPLLIAGGAAKTFRWEFFSWDHLGSVSVVTDATGAKVWETKYLPYGEEIGTSAASNNSHRFTSHERDGDTGLDYMNARYYTNSRFISADSISASAESDNPASWNGYAYAGSNPVIRYDPDGQAPTAVHWGSTFLIMALAGFDLDFAEAVAQADAATDRWFSKTWWGWSKARAPFHAFGCRSACLDEKMATASTLALDNIVGIGRAMHFIGDQPFHRDLEPTGAHEFGGDNIKTHKEEFLEMVHNKQQFADTLAERMGLPPPQHASGEFWESFAEGDGRVMGIDEGEVDILVDTLADAQKMANVVRGDSAFSGVTVNIYVRPAWAVFMNRAEAIGGGDTLGLSTMPKDCGPYAADGTC
jgi:RHS repeat-associated protein